MDLEPKLKGSEKSDRGSLRDGHPASLNARSMASPEGRIFLIGSILAMLYAVWLVSSFFATREHFEVYFGMTVSHVFFGRAAGMSFGYALDYGHPVVILVNLAIETILILLFYPLFVFSIRRLLVVGFLKRYMDRMREAAEANQAKIRRYGIPGLFVFVFIPFWMTGPLVGSVIGYMMGLRLWLNLSIVIGGTYFAILAWAVLLKELRDHLASVSAFAPFLLVVVVIAIVVLGRLLERTGRRRPDRH